MRHRPVTGVLAAGAAVITFALAGCGGEDEPTSTSSSTPTAESSESPAEGASETPAAEGEANVGDVIATAMEKGKTAHITMTMADQLDAEGDIDLSEGAPAMDLTMRMQGQQVRMLMVDGVVYMKMPQTGDKFMKIDAAQAGAMGTFDPSQMLEQLRQMKGGEDLGDGHYRYSQDGATTDLYVGDDDLIERIVVDAGTGKIEMTYSDWGKDVDIDAPAAKDVTEMPTAPPAG